LAATLIWSILPCLTLICLWSSVIRCSSLEDSLGV